MFDFHMTAAGQPQMFDCRRPAALHFLLAPHTYTEASLLPSLFARSTEIPGPSLFARSTEIPGGSPENLRLAALSGGTLIC